MICNLDRKKCSKRTWSLAASLTLWYTASTFLIVLAATTILYWALVTNLDRQDDQFLADEVHIIENVLAERPEYLDALRQEVEWEPQARRYAKVFERLLDGEGKIIVETPKMAERLPVEIFPIPVGSQHVAAGIDLFATDGTPFRAISVKQTSATSGGVHVIQVAMDRVQQLGLKTTYFGILLVVLLAALAISTVAAFWIASRGIRPIVDVTATARRIRSTTLHERIETGAFPSELSSLVETFNGMLDRLEESFERLSRFSADIAHELRTPVNNLRGEAEVVLNKPRTADEYHQSLASCLEEAVRLSKLIEGLLLMARAESPDTEIQRETLDLSEELCRIREFYEAAIDEADIDLIIEADSPLQVSANRSLFQRAIGNLIDNALAHTGGGTIAISVRRDGDQARIEVIDDGCGIPEDHLPHVFGRFYRVHRDRSSKTGGSGLGLAIVHSIVQLHGGQVSIDSSLGGTAVVVTFPVVVKHDETVIFAS